MKKLFFPMMIVFVLVFTLFFASAASFSSSVQNRPYTGFQNYYSSNDLKTYWPILVDSEQCEARQDILLNVAPAGCQPRVVRSDLLAEQNVPVFCQIDALQVNPLIDIKQINNLRFTGKYPEGVVGAGFHPARAALQTRDKLLGDPLVNNIGYVVVVLKKQPIESKLPDYVSVNLTALIDYNSGNAFGIGRNEYILKPVTDEEWENEQNKNGFWNGNYFVRLDDVEPDRAIVSLYEGDRKIVTTSVERGKQSRTIYMPGLYCQAGINILYNGFVGAKEKARLEIVTADETLGLDVYQGSKFLNNKCTVTRLNVLEDNSGSVEISCSGNSKRLILNMGPKKVGTNDKDKPQELEDISLEDQEELAFKEALQGYLDVAEQYPSEKVNNLDVLPSYGESALREALKLVDSANAKKYTKAKTEKEILTKLIQEYPNSNYRNDYEQRLQKLVTYDLTESAGVVQVDNRFSNIRLIGLKNISEEERSSAAFSFSNIPGRTELIKEGYSEIDFFKDKSTSITKFDVVDVVDEERARVNVYCKNQNKDTNKEDTKSTILLNTENDAQEVCNGETIKLESIDLKSFAKIQLVPSVKGTRSEVNLTVSVGIEKRAIKLNPEKNNERIKNLNESIAKWESISKKLGNLVSGLKGACFATAAVLNIKNLVTGIDGSALARQQTMQGPNGWIEKCKVLIAQGVNGEKYSTPTECFNAKKDEIEKEIQIRQATIKESNSKMQGVESLPGITAGSNDLFGSGKVVDTGKARKALCEQLQSDPAFKDGIGNGVDCNAEPNKIPFSYEDLRNWYYNQQLASKGVDSATKELENIKNRVESQKQTIKQISDSKASTILSDVPANSESLKEVYGRFREIKDNKIDGVLVNGESINSATESHAVKILVREGTVEKPENKLYLVTGTKGATGVLNPTKVYTYSEKEGAVELQSTPEDARSFLTTKAHISLLRDSQQRLVGNSIIDRDRSVRYFATGPDKDMPALVPFDLDNGWYVRVVSGLGENKAYDSSGLPRGWIISNVGEDGQVNELSDDQQYVDRGTSPDILGLSSSESQKLIRNSQQALMDAARQRGSPVIKILDQNVRQGTPVTHYNAAECQEFMSIDDCKILFNLCDPVICPATRCNFGGQYQVADVIQTGIVGSALLCLPNAKEGVYLPICLTGIHAGIDSYVSILKNHRDCLQESVNTGKVTAICDEIYSIYACEFFWNQVAPAANALLPKIVESAYNGGSGARGGGEYSTVTQAWQNTEKSVDYFKNQYAVNSLKAFNLRSSSDVGTQFCKAFVSAKGPNSFKSLIEPDSPPQFYAWYSEHKYTDATVPATSQYKVFYHIFAGKDSGVTYSIYLKNPPQSALYSQSERITVASGFITSGEYASQTKDFTAPEGYKELCVRINEKEECGFKQVSTDFAVNALNDKFTQDELQRTDIKSEQECMSGSLTVGALLQPNAQAGVEEAINPSLDKRGIVRICATRNPGASTEPTRYVNVGNCGREDLVCWLDKQSVDNAITDANIGAKDETLESLERTQKELLGNEGFYIGDEVVGLINDLDNQVGALVKNFRDGKEKEVENKVNAIKQKIDQTFGVLDERLVYNHHKAQVSLMRARLKGILAESKIQVVKEREVEPKVENSVEKLYIDGKDRGIYIQNGKVYYESASVQALEIGEYSSSIVIYMDKVNTQNILPSETKAYLIKINGFKIEDLGKVYSTTSEVPSEAIPSDIVYSVSQVNLPNYNPQSGVYANGEYAGIFLQGGYVYYQLSNGQAFNVGTYNSKFQIDLNKIDNDANLNDEIKNHLKNINGLEIEPLRKALLTPDSLKTIPIEDILPEDEVVPRTESEKLEPKTLMYSLRESDISGDTNSRLYVEEEYVNIFLTSSSVFVKTNENTIRVGGINQGFIALDVELIENLYSNNEIDSKMRFNLKNIYIDQKKIDSLKTGVIVKDNRMSFNEIFSYLETASEKYSSNPENKNFVDRLYEDGRITLKEYNSIKGVGLFVLEKDMKYVLELLQKKYPNEFKALSFIGQ